MPDAGFDGYKSVFAIHTHFRHYRTMCHMYAYYVLAQLIFGSTSARGMCFISYSCECHSLANLHQMSVWDAAKSAPEFTKEIYTYIVSS